MRVALVLALLLLAPALAGCAEPKTTSTPPAVQVRDCAPAASNPTWKLDTTMGTICVELFEDKTPMTAKHFVNLTKQGYFDGTKFHRVVEGFMDQGGDPLTKDDAQASRWGTGGPGYTIKDEFYCADGTVSTTHPASCPTGLGLKHDAPGTLSMANTGRPATGGSQFFLTAVPTPHLDGKHSVFGRTADAESLAVVLAINKVETNGDPPLGQNRPLEAVVLTKATIVEASS